MGVLGAVPAAALALRALADTLLLSLAVDADQLVDKDWDRVFGGSSPERRATGRFGASLRPSSPCRPSTIKETSTWRSCAPTASSIPASPSS